jgi:hypothetical protein
LRLQALIDEAGRNGVAVIAEFMPEAKLIQEVGRRFKQVSKVASIYLENSYPGMIFFCFLDHDQYDDRLMDQLLDIEWGLYAEFPRQKFDVHYLPLFAKDQGVLSVNAKNILPEVYGEDGDVRCLKYP